MLSILNAIVIVPVVAINKVDSEKRRKYIKRVTRVALVMLVVSVVLLHFMQLEIYVTNFLGRAFFFVFILLLDISLMSRINKKKFGKKKVRIYQNYIVPLSATFTIYLSIGILILAGDSAFVLIAESREQSRMIDEERIIIEMMPTTEDCYIIARGTLGHGGAVWLLCDNGVVRVGGGTIFHDGNLSTSNLSITSAWHERNCDIYADDDCYRHDIDIRKIIFTEPVVAQRQLTGLFAQLRNLEIIENIHYIDTTMTIDMRSMFRRTGLTNLDLSSWNTSNLRAMSQMFALSRNLVYLDVSTWDISQVTSLLMVFDGIDVAILDVADWDTSNVTSMWSTFGLTENLVSLDVSNWDVSNVTDMSSMFSRSGITELDLSNWNTSNVEAMDFMMSLEVLTLGSNFQFINSDSRSPILREIRPTTAYTGYWQNVGTGTIDAPNGEHILTSAELIEQFDGSTMADTFVWQRQAEILLSVNIYHTVEWGDTLSELAVRFQTTIDELVRLNNIDNPNLIFTEQALILPQYEINAD